MIIDMKQIVVDVLLSIIILWIIFFKILCVVVDGHSKFNFISVRVTLNQNL